MRPLFLSDHIPSLSGPHPVDPSGVRYVFDFPNKYGASVIKTQSSIGGSANLWEIAVLNNSGEIVYDNHITGQAGALGFLTEQEVSDILYEISDL